MGQSVLTGRCFGGDLAAAVAAIFPCRWSARAMSIINPEYVERIKTMVRRSPYPAHMSMTIEDLQVGSCKIELTVLPEHFQPFGVVHGGVIATLIDTATFWAVFLSLERPDDGLTNVDL